MSPLRENVILLILIAVVIVAVLVGVFAAFGPPGLYAKSESPEYCGSCHVLQPEYEAWFHSGAHAQIKCIDCHLPNDNLPHHLWAKALEGVGDTLAFHTGRVHEPIKLSDSGAKVVVANCRRCHAELVARINEDRPCWECHRRMSHRSTGAIATLTP
jgi:cytochrome c nitrite reductase small subunit